MYTEIEFWFSESQYFLTVTTTLSFYKGPEVGTMCAIMIKEAS